METAHNDQGEKSKTTPSPYLPPPTIHPWTLQFYTAVHREQLRFFQRQNLSTLVPVTVSMAKMNSRTNGTPIIPWANPVYLGVPHQPKPTYSYIGLIAMAILSSPQQKLILSEIYARIMDKYPYFRHQGPGWRNSIRHNLSLNECFVKAGRSQNGKGHYWTIHPANVEDFKRGDFRRKRARTSVLKHAVGLRVDPTVAGAIRGMTVKDLDNPSGLMAFGDFPINSGFPLRRASKRHNFSVDSLLASKHDKSTSTSSSAFTSSTHDSINDQ